MHSQSQNMTDKINLELVSLLFANFHFLLLCESFGAIIFIMLLWNAVYHPLLLIWLSGNFLINGLTRHILTFQFHRHKRNGTLGNITYWKNWFTLAALMAGCVWGLGGCLFLYAPDDLHCVIIILVLTALTGGVANAILFPIKSAYLAFVIPMYAAIIFIILSQSTMLYFSLSLAEIIFMVITIHMTFKSSEALVDSFWLQYKYEELLDYLSLAKNELENTNQLLSNEIDARRETEKLLHTMATHDSLTGLANRNLLYIELSQAIARSSRYEIATAVLFLDLDFFKEINDKLGHDVGDKLLVEVSRRIQKIVRPNDIFARLGGDEFCIVITDIADLHDINDIASHIILILAVAFIINDHSIQVSTSIGISIFPDDGEDIETLLRKADLALYSAKANGRNRYKFYDPKCDQYHNNGGNIYK